MMIRDDYGMSARQALVATSGRAGLAEGRIPQAPLKPYEVYHDGKQNAND